MNEQEMMEDLKFAIQNKTECMIESYGEVIKKTAKMFRSSDIRNISDDEIAKRADMFWNIALQRATQPMPQQQMMPQGMPRKSPCQEKAEKQSKIIEEEKNINKIVIE